MVSMISWLIGRAIEVAEQDRKRFDDWKTQGCPKAGSSAESKQEMEEIVTSEQTELEVIKTYCEKDVKKISKWKESSVARGRHI